MQAPLQAQCKQFKCRMFTFYLAIYLHSLCVSLSGEMLQIVVTLSDKLILSGRDICQLQQANFVSSKKRLNANHRLEIIPGKIINSVELSVNFSHNSETRKMKGVKKYKHILKYMQNVIERKEMTDNQAEFCAYINIGQLHTEI